MHPRLNLLRVATGLSMMILFSVTSLQPAQANTLTLRCNSGVYWYAGSTSSYSYTRSNHCRTKYLKVTYNSYQGGPQYTTGWYYSATYIKKYFSNISTAWHKVGSCVYPYNCYTYSTHA